MRPDCVARRCPEAVLGSVDSTGSKFEDLPIVTKTDGVTFGGTPAIGSAELESFVAQLEWMG